MAKGEAAQQPKRWRRDKQGEAQAAQAPPSNDAIAPAPAAAPAAQPVQLPAEPTGWEELDAPQDVQQQAGACGWALGDRWARAQGRRLACMAAAAAAVVPGLTPPTALPPLLPQSRRSRRSTAS
jgi:hypothetical protein